MRQYRHTGILLIPLYCNELLFKTDLSKIYHYICHGLDNPLDVTVADFFRKLHIKYIGKNKYSSKQYGNV